MANPIRPGLLANLVVGGSLKVIDAALFQIEPIAAGRPGGEASLNPDAFGRLARSTARALSELPAEPRSDADAFVLWREGESDLLVRPGDLTARLVDGIVAFSLPVGCDQSGATQVHVSFFVGAPNRPAGMVAATEQRPRGPAAVVDVWGEQIVAFAWRVLLEIAVRLAADCGRDEDGAALLPAAMQASANGFSVTPMARHEMDRVST